jgi:hypothetical protein
MWTLEYGGAEKSFDDWGFSLVGSTLELFNMAPDVLALVSPGACDRAVEFAYDGAVVVRRDRVAGAGGTFSGGTIFFRGRAVDPERVGEGAQEGLVYRFVGPWADFEECVYQQTWRQFAGWENGDPNGNPTFTETYASEVFIGMATDGTRLNTGEQIEDAVAWAIECGVSVQIGTIDPAVNIMLYHARDTMVSEVINQMLRVSPDCVGFFDYATTPPTFHVRSLANMTSVALDVRGHPGLRLRPRHDLQVPAVCLKFKILDVIDGRPCPVIVQQNYPLTATGKERRALIHTIELAGTELSHLQVQISCAAIGAVQSANNDIRLAWWKGRDPQLGSTKVNPNTVTVSVAEVTDESGNPVSLDAYPFELIDGAVDTWMSSGGVSGSWKRVTVKAVATFDLYRIASGWADPNAAKFLVEKQRQIELSATGVIVTNLPTGTYRRTESYVEGEAVPLGLAQAIYESHSALQFEGSVTLVGAEVPADAPGLGCKVDVQTGDATYANCMVQGVAMDLGSGKVTLRVGPAAHLGVSDLIELMRVNRYRVVQHSPATRTSASVSSGTITLPKVASARSTTGGNGDREQLGLSAPVTGGTATIRQDAANKRFTIEVVNDSGVVQVAAGQIIMELVAGKEIKMREWDVCATVDGQQVNGKAHFLSSGFVQNP